MIKIPVLKNIVTHSSFAPSTCSYDFSATITATILLLRLSLRFLTVYTPWFFRIRRQWEFQTWGAEGRFVIVYIFVCVDNYPEINDAYFFFISKFIYVASTTQCGQRCFIFLSFYTFLDCHDHFEAPGSNIFECISFLFFFCWLLLVLSNAWLLLSYKFKKRTVCPC